MVEEFTSKLPPEVSDDITGPPGQPPLWHVVLYNDDVNAFEHVVGVLCGLFQIYPLTAAMMAKHAHENGEVVFCKEPFDHAQFHVEWLRSNGLRASIREV